MGSWKGRGNRYIEFARVVYCKLPTNGKQLPAFPLKAITGIEPIVCCNPNLRFHMPFNKHSYIMMYSIRTAPQCILFQTPDLYVGKLVVAYRWLAVYSTEP